MDIEKIINPREILKYISEGRIVLVPYNDIFPSVMECMSGVYKEREEYKLLPTQPIFSHLIENPQDFPKEWREGGHTHIIFGIKKYFPGFYTIFFQMEPGCCFDVLEINSETRLLAKVLSTGFDYFGYVPVIVQPELVPSEKI